MRSVYQRVVVAAVILLTACAPQGADTSSDSAAAATVDPAAVRTAIEAANSRFVEAFNRGDIEATLANYAPDALVMVPNQPAWNGHDGIRAGGKAMFAALTPSGAVLHTDDVRLAGDLAIETGRYEMTLTPKAPGAKPIQDKGKFLVVWQRQADGSWKIIRDINNSDLPAPTG
jgi:uncharacterized protein (TIGR02246 family)